MRARTATSLVYRLATPEDQSFLFELYRSTRADELTSLGWAPDEITAFCRMQFAAQTRVYAGRYRQAEDLILLVENVAAGRVCVERTSEQILLVDIALLPEFRNRGIGSEVMRRLIDEADEKNLPLRLHALLTSKVLTLYERLGFRRIGDDQVYVALEHVPTSREKQDEED